MSLGEDQLTLEFMFLHLHSPGYVSLWLWCAYVVAHMHHPHLFIWIVKSFFKASFHLVCCGTTSTLQRGASSESAGAKVDDVLHSGATRQSSKLFLNSSKLFKNCVGFVSLTFTPYDVAEHIYCSEIRIKMVLSVPCQKYYLFRFPFVRQKDNETAALWLKLCVLYGYKLITGE